MYKNFPLKIKYTPGSQTGWDTLPTRKIGQIMVPGKKNTLKFHPHWKTTLNSHPQWEEQKFWPTLLDFLALEARVLHTHWHFVTSCLFLL